MTDRPDLPESPGSSGPGAAESPEIAEVRRLLADARHTGPMPDDVVDRMDRMIARLGDETRAPAAEPAPEAAVVPIAAYRRRRAAALLVAAAAVVVGGVVVVPHLPRGGSASPAGSSAQDSTAGGGYELGNTGNGGSNTSGGKTSAPSSTPHRLAPVRHGRIVVRPQQFPFAALQGRRLLDRRTEAMDQAAVLGCSGLPRSGRVVPAEYQHAPAALVYRQAVGTSQVVDLYVCGSTRPIRSTTLPAP